MKNANLFPQDFAPTKEQWARLNERHKRIIDANAIHVEGKTILDLACANGRWTWAAANAGAAKVLGIEGRADKVAEARALIERQGMADKCRFECCDMYDWLYSAETNEKFNTIFCLGVYYHVLDHYMLIRLMAKREPDVIIIDSTFIRSFELLVDVHTENPTLWTSALPSFAGQKQQLVGRVSLGLMVQMAMNCGYRCEPVTWNPREVSSPAAVPDYIKGQRFTLRLLKSPSPNDSAFDWKTAWRATLRTLNPRFEAALEPRKGVAGLFAKFKASQGT